MQALALAILVAAAPPGFTNKKLTLELKEADADNVFKLLAQFSATNIDVDECVKGRKLDIVLKNAPATLVMDVIAAKINVSYEGTDPIHVRCNQGTVPPPSREVAKALEPMALNALWDVHAEIDSKDTGAKSMLGFVAWKLGLKGGVDFRGPDRKIDLTMKNVRLAIITEAIKDSAYLESITVEGDKLVVVSKPDNPK